MPAPSAAQLEPLALGFVQGAGLKGDNAPELAAAIAEALAAALDQLVKQAQVAPAIACTPAATAAPGRLM